MDSEVFDLKALYDILSECSFTQDKIARNLFSVKRYGGGFFGETPNMNKNIRYKTKNVAKFYEALEHIEEFTNNIMSFFVDEKTRDCTTRYVDFVNALEAKNFDDSQEIISLLNPDEPDKEKREQAMTEGFRRVFTQVFNNSANELKRRLSSEDAQVKIISAQKQEQQLIQLLEEMRDTPLAEYEKDMICSVLHGFLLKTEKTLYFERFDRIDTIEIDEEKSEITKTVKTDFTLAAETPEEIKHMLSRKYTCKETVDDILKINTGERESERREIFNDAYADIKITIGEDRLDKDKCFKYFRVDTDPLLFKPGTPLNMTTVLVLDEAIQDYCKYHEKNEVRIVSDEIRTVPLDSSALWLTYRLQHHAKEFEFSCMFTENTPSHWKISLMPIFPGYAIYSKYMHPYYKQHGNMDNRNPRGPKFSFGNWLPQGTGISYNIDYGKDYCITKRCSP